MKYLIITIITLLFSCKKKEDNPINEFLEDFYSLSNIDKNSLVICNKGSDYFYEVISEANFSDTIFGKKKDKFFILNEDERNFIKKEIEKLNSFSWTKSKIDAKTIIPIQTFEKIFNDENSIKNFFNRNRGLVIYSFSKPIFLRNDSICIFAYAYYCGMECTAIHLSIYEKANSRWIKAALISGSMA
jgi:hypothetical protein